MLTAAVLSGAFAVGAAHSADRPPKAPGDVVGDFDTPPQRLTMSISDIEAVWPEPAHGHPGSARMKCVVTIQGALRDCKVVSESPENKGFGAAALLLSQSMRYKPALKAGKPVETTVTTGVNWKGENDPTAPSYRILKGAPWVTAPTAAEVIAAYPKGAWAKKVIGQVVLRCAIDFNGHLTECDVITEQPYGSGFGSAARSLSKRFSVLIGGTDRKLIHTLRVNVPVHFVPTAASDPPRYLAKADWTKTVDPKVAVAAFPAKAADAGLAVGRASLDCLVAAGGQLDACTVLREDPAGMDFGPSALAIAPALAVNPWTDDGLPAEGARVRFVIRVDKEADPPAAPKP